MHKERTIRKDFLVLPSLTSFKMLFNISLYSSNMSLSSWRRTPRRCRFWSSRSCHRDLQWQWHKCTCSRCGLATRVKTNKRVVYGIIMLPLCVLTYVTAGGCSQILEWVIRSPQSPTSVSPLIVIPAMLHTNLQYTALLPTVKNARNFGTFHKPPLCGKSVEWYIKYFQLVLR